MTSRLLVRYGHAAVLLSEVVVDQSFSEIS